jgi:outer membrane immunogenic protein
MKKLGLAALVLVSCAGFAQAADMPVKAVAPIAVAYNWNGFYTGVNVGYSWGRADTEPNGSSRTQIFRAFGLPAETLLFDSGTVGAPVGASTTDVDGWIGGVQGGWNWQRGAWLWGIEGDIQASGERGSTTIGFIEPGVTIPGVGTIPAFTGTASVDHKLRWFGTLRPRVGWLPTDRLVLYATGGLAVGELESTYSTVITGIGSFAASNRVTRAGWTVGAGAEGALWGNWTAKIEYLYMDLGSFSGVGPSGALILPNIPDVGLTTVSSFSAAPTATFTDHIVRVGVNYRWLAGMP